MTPDAAGRIGIIRWSGLFSASFRRGRMRLAAVFGALW
jgi:hypothetical protein